jgi:hypothetical protein
MAFDILSRIDALSPTNLTIREQARLAENPNDTRWQVHAPVVPVNSVKLGELEGVDFRPAADYRAWNAQGREIPEVMGPGYSFKLKPMTATFHFDEERMQELAAPAPGLRQLIDNGLIDDVNTKPQTLANAVDVGTERAFFQGWITNAFTVMDPKTGSTVPVALGIDSARYPTEGTAWGTGGLNEWDRLLFHIGEANRLIAGGVGGFRIKRADLALAIADAPVVENGIRVTFGNVNDVLSLQGYGPIAAVIDERTYDQFTDGGSAYASQPVMPADRIAFFPRGGVVGRTPAVEVVRAYNFVQRDQRVNFRDVVVLYHTGNNGRSLLIEAEAIRLPVPFKNRVYVVKVR